MRSYSIFAFEPMRNLHFIISRLIQEYMVNYCSSDSLGSGGAQK